MPSGNSVGLVVDAEVSVADASGELALIGQDLDGCRGLAVYGGLPCSDELLKISTGLRCRGLKGERGDADAGRGEQGAAHGYDSSLAARLEAGLRSMRCMMRFSRMLASKMPRALVAVAAGAAQMVWASESRERA